MLRGIGVLVVAAWVAVSLVWDGSQRRRDSTLAEMKDSYSKKETLDLIYEMKHRAVMLYLVYGILLGALVVPFLQKP